MATAVAPQEPAPSAKETVWVRGQTVDPEKLDDKRLTDYRHPDERRMLVGLVAGLAIIARSWRCWGQICAPRSARTSTGCRVGCSVPSCPSSTRRGSSAPWRSS